MHRYYVELSMKGGQVGVQIESEDELDEVELKEMARERAVEEAHSATVDFWSKSGD